MLLQLRSLGSCVCIAAGLFGAAEAAAAPFGSLSIANPSSGLVNLSATRVDFALPANPPAGSAGIGDFAVGLPTVITYSGGVITPATNPYGAVKDIDVGAGAITNFIQLYTGLTPPIPPGNGTLQTMPTFDLTALSPGGSAQGALNDCAGVTAVGVSCSPLIAVSGNPAFVSPLVMTNQGPFTAISLGVVLLAKDATGNSNWSGGFTMEVQGSTPSALQALLNTGATISSPYSAVFEGLAPPTPPAIAKQFGAPSVGVNGSTSLTFTVTNPNAQGTLTGVAFTDTLPVGLVVSSPNGLSGTCFGGTITATAGSNAISLSGGTAAPSASCTFSVSVTGTTVGVKNNSVTATATESGSGTAGTASLTVLALPTIVKSFAAPTVPLNGSIALTFLITNTDSANALDGAGFTDTLPAGLVVSTPNGLTGSCGGGAITATAATGTITLSGATLPANGSCTFSVNVTGTTAGLMTNAVTVSSNQTGPGTTSTATVTVMAPPTIGKSFGATVVPVSQTTTLTFQVANPNATLPLTGVGFTDAFPGGLVIATPNNLTGACGGGTIAAVSGTGLVMLSGATLGPGAVCSFSIDVMPLGFGPLTNVTSPVTSLEGGVGGVAAATLSAVEPPFKPIPTLSEWGLLVLALLLGLAASRGMSRPSGR